ncbi:hypothetical protein HMPREF2981_08475 [Rothia sp. HMSC069C01]|nr:hypothetical protein HMPREF2981_08475 [Rothia sp. HMSC069C01]
MNTIQGQMRMCRDQLQQMGAHLGDNPLVLTLGLLCCFQVVQGAFVSIELIDHIRDSTPGLWGFLKRASMTITTEAVRAVISDIKPERLISTILILGKPKLTMMMLHIPPLMFFFSPGQFSLVHLYALVTLMGIINRLSILPLFIPPIRVSLLLFRTPVCI